MEEYLSQIYAILEPSQMTALQEYLPLDSPGSVTVHQVAAALTAINAPTVAMNAVHSFCEKHGIPVDWLDDSQEADGVDQRAEIAGAANSIVSKPSEEQTEGAMRINTCTEGGLSTEHVPVGEQPQAPFTTQTGRAAPPKISTHAQESAKGSNIPATFHSYLRATTVGIKRGDGVTEAMEFKYDVMRQLDELFKSKPSALGIFIPFVSPKGFEQREDLPSLVDGAEELKKAFSFLGHAVFKLKPNVDLESWQLKAALEGIAAMVSKCPASFQQICIYFTGHGGENVVYTPDGAVLLTSFTDPFCTAPAPQDDPLPKVFIFDTCNFGVKNILQDSIAAVNTICVFASIPGNRAFAKENGCGLLTSHLAKAIQTIGKPFSLVVADAAEEVRKEINKHPEYGVVEPAECQPLVCQASRPLNLLENRRKAMTPEIQIELHPTAVCVKVSFTPSASHFNLTGCCVQCEGPNGIEQCKQLSLPGTNQVCIDGLSPGKESRLKAVAKYVPDGFPEEEVSSEEERVRIRPEVMPTVERGPTRTSVLVTSPRLHQQYNMQSLSLKYWAEDEGEEHAQSVDVEFEADQEQVDLTTQREKTCKVKAVAMYAFPPGSEVSSPILTIHREERSFKVGTLLALLPVLNLLQPRNEHNLMYYFRDIY